MQRAADHPRRHARQLKIGILAGGAILLVLFWSVVVISILLDRDAALQRAQSEAANLAAAFTDEVSDTVDGVDTDMEFLASRMRAQGSPVDIYAWADQIPKTSAGTLQAYFIGPDGKLVSNTLDPHPEAIDLSDREHFRVHLDGSFKGLFISEPVVGPVSEQATIQVSKRVEATDGRFLGVLVFSLLPSNLAPLHQSIDLGERGVMTLAGLDGVLRARFSRTSPEGMAGLRVSLAGEPRPAAMFEGAQGTYIREGVVDHVRRIFSYRRVPSRPLVVSVGLDPNDAYAVSNLHALLLIFLSTLATLLLGGLAVFLTREITNRAEREIELGNERSKLSAANSELAEDQVKLQTMNSELTVSKERAEEANRAKSLLLAHMSHELRTPLNAVIGFSEIIKNQMVGPIGNPSYADYARDIHESGKHLLEVVDNLLDIAKIESGKLSLREETVPLMRALEITLTAVRTQAHKKRISIDIALESTVSELFGDELKLCQALMNLLSNAVKFTPDGGRISIGVHDTRDGGLVITLMDTGIGMTDDEILVALQPFQQVDNGLDRKYEGSGLGLPLAKHFIEAHGGTLAIASRKGKGTPVSVRLPPERVGRSKAPKYSTAAD